MSRASQKRKLTNGIRHLKRAEKKACGESCLSKTQTYEWYKAFKEGREEIQDLPRFSRPSTVSTGENIEKIKKMVIENRRVSVREVAHEVEMSHMSVRNILTEVLGMRRVAARLVPKELNFLQKEHRKVIAEDYASDGAYFEGDKINLDE
ncbi:Putative uncharacterized protein FLJ37770 [Habropoda laboriosa]|uniref:Mos1 transposase HTH domain-containing protein n=1 Tax=Habropoda laboriosa TaxID=597456 RepID=A0A0L7QMN0_9HYME|nr:Putative uncharacterized protein FLJ37770 [Habropoda laboriosa]